MKKTIILALGLFLSLLAYSQTWAPVGAVWHYSESPFWPWPIAEDYIMLESVKDTVFNGIDCRKITKRHPITCGGRPYVEYMYSVENKVYFWDLVLNKFQMLYDFDKVEGESWIIEVYDLDDDIDTLIITVDSTNIININGVDKKRLYVTYSFYFEDMLPWLMDTITYTSTIIESIGDIHYMFNFQPQWAQVCDGNISQGLRCYSDTELGLYETGIAPYCTYVDYVGIDDNNKNDLEVILYPNPCNGSVSVKTNLAEPVLYRIIDISGKVISSGILTNNKIAFDDKTNGLFIVELFGDDNRSLFRSKLFVY